MGIRSAIEKRGQYAEDGARLAEVITGIIDETPADWFGSRVSTTELPDAIVIATTRPSHGSGKTVSRLQVYPKDATLDGLGVSLRGSAITGVDTLRPNIPGDDTSGHQTLPEFTGSLIKPVDALRYGAGDTPVIIGGLLSNFGDFVE